ncbi:MAG TPA: UDP-glucose 4-epimerase GalE [Deltaproteobacteria bacterium]|nr:UDP-glucose 4-epimerase GalE [Deltaproteobacteria bacterium]HCP46846.1 UDP-glucose 4-epimerase GalE [Deltaproteobacteria bacterium]
MVGAGCRDVLLTGGAGYIGAHCAALLASEGYRVTVFDNLERGYRQAIQRASMVSGKPIELIVGDVRDMESLRGAFAQGDFHAVVHLAALKSVEESIQEPERYQHTNVMGTENLCAAMEEFGVFRLVFSSSAAVYGDCGSDLATESTPLRPLSPYGQSKVDAEERIERFVSRTGAAAVSLRYFNPVGAHPSASLGECSDGPTNLIPVVMDVVLGNRRSLDVFGRDYPTRDGTCIRDYIHIMDLVVAHRSALDHTTHMDGAKAYNVGTGRGSSVLEVVDRAREVTQRVVPTRDAARRDGDPVMLVADVSRIEADLGWVATQDLKSMIRSEWAWRRAWPDGYASSRETSAAPR